MTSVQLYYSDKESIAYKVAKDLKSEFENWLQNRSDKNDQVFIASNLKLYGEKVCDLDVLVAGRFGNGMSKKSIFFDKNDEKHYRPVFIDSFCFAINIRQENNSEILIEGDQIFTITHKRKASLSKHCNNIKNSARSFLIDFTGKESNPIVTPIILFQQIIEKKGVVENSFYAPYLRSHLTLDKLFQSAFIQKNPKENAGKLEKPNYFTYSSFFHKETNIEMIGNAIKMFGLIKKGIGPLTKQKLDFMTKKRVEEPVYAQKVGKELVVIKGGAGTGKTLKIMQLAQQCYLGGNRSLVLTYNRALAQDITRLIQLSEIKDNPNSPTISIQTIHSFMYPLLTSLCNIEDRVVAENFLTSEQDEKIVEEPNLNDRAAVLQNFGGLIYLKYYSDFLAQALQKWPEFLKSSNLESDDPEIIKQHEEFKKQIEELRNQWDYIFIDEGQDWYREERDLLYRIFGPEKFVVATGDQQLIRTNDPLDWQISAGKPISSHQVSFPSRSLRQKSNLCKFQQIFAEKFRVDWNVRFNPDLEGGKIFVTTKGMNKQVAEYLKNCTKGYSKDLYDDLLFLVPPTSTSSVKVNKTIHLDGEKSFVWNLKSRSFSSLNEWEEMGLKIFDGTFVHEDGLKQPVPGEYRLITYESCRGLESYGLVAVEMDLFFESKQKHYSDSLDSQKQGDLYTQGLAERANRFAAMWSLIVFSRPVDFLLITIKNKDSDFFRVMKEIASDNPDLIEILDI